MYTKSHAFKINNFSMQLYDLIRLKQFLHNGNK
jgi:hypothetical protein